MDCARSAASPLFWLASFVAWSRSARAWSICCLSCARDSDAACSTVVAAAAVRACRSWNCAEKLKSDVSAKMDELKTRADKRADQLDAKITGTDADWAEMDAADAIDYAAWAMDNARLAVLDALDARAYATQLEKSVHA